MARETATDKFQTRELQIQAHKNSDVRRQRNEAIEALESIIISLGTKQIGGHYIQNYPIRLNVWRAFATRPNDKLNLIITPNYLVPIKQAGKLIKQGLKIESVRALKEYRLITLSNSIHVRLELKDLLTGILPVTYWWHSTGAPALSNLINKITSDANADGKADFSLLCTDAEIPPEEQDGFLDRASSLIEEDYVAVIRPIAAWAIIQRASDICNDILTKEIHDREQQKEKEDENSVQYIGRVSSQNTKSDLEIQITVETERYRLIQRYCEILLNLNKTIGGLSEELEGKGVDKSEAIAFLLKIGEFLQQLKCSVPDEKGENDATKQTEVRDITQPVWSIDVNRRGDWAVSASRLTVKADAAEQVFGGNTRNISWAVIDSGIDARHPAFRIRYKERTTVKTAEVENNETPEDSPLNNTRIKASYDFFRLMYIFKGEYDKLVSDDALKQLEEKLRRSSDKFDFDIKDEVFKESDEYLEARNQVILTHIFNINVPEVPPKLTQIDFNTAFQDQDFSDEALSYASSIEEIIVSGEPIDWYLMEPLLRIPHSEGHYIPPANEHGTHVAGILAGNLKRGDLLNTEDKTYPEQDQIGICPKMGLYDLRVCNEAGESEEFLVLAAMQFISHLNSNRNLPKVHGANVSLSLKHAVQDYACGQTPICVESNRLVGEGVVVVAAAGNLGFQHLRSDNGFFQAYNGISITDPGNAADVITVGSTFRDKPHIYGVSYFSSRGPTGDGRQKPDIVAPGERIFSAMPDNGFGVLDGTSMAAPHVSGAAALLMARHNELIGDPQRVKTILCDTATDIGRVKEFQGAGLVDIFRAIQSV